MLQAIIDILIWIMDKTHYVTRTWAVDIVVLTVIVRYLLYPLNARMNKSMKLMQKLQPEMKQIQEKYRDKPEVAQREIMELYRRYKVNPFSSCWPILVQMPIFVALFWMLRDPRHYLRLPGFGHATFFGSSLTIPPLFSHPYPEVALKAGVFNLYGLLPLPLLADRFLYLPTLWIVALYIATTIIQSRQMQAQSQTAGAGQSSQMAFMLPMFIIFGLLFPTGLLVYFVTSNILQMAQYWRIQRELALEEGQIEEVRPKKRGAKPGSNKTLKGTEPRAPRASNKIAASERQKQRK